MRTEGRNPKRLLVCKCLAVFFFRNQVICTKYGPPDFPDDEYDNNNDNEIYGDDVQEEVKKIRNRQKVG